MRRSTQINIPTVADIEQLSVPPKGSRMAISLYLGIRADRDFLAVANSLFSEEGKRIEASRRFSAPDRKKIAAAFGEMESKLRVIKLPDRTRVFAVFFDEKGGFRIYKIPVYIPSKLVVERDFYIHPFIKNLQKYPRYCVVFLARDRARIFDYFWGEVEDETEEIRSSVPQRMNAARASWKGLSEKRILKHIDVHIDWHLKKIADTTDTYMRKNKIPYLVIGSHRELIERFSQYLPVGIRKRVVGSYLIRTDQSLKKIKEKSLETISLFEFEKENEMIGRIVEGNSKKKKGAVLGIEPVLQKLNEYAVHSLVIGKNYAQGGYLCLDNHSVCAYKEGQTLCRTEMDEVSDMADELIQTAIAKRIKIVHFLHDHEDFDQFGIGAILK